MSAPVEASQEDYADVIEAVIADVRTKFSMLDFVLRIEFLDRLTAQFELMVFEEGKPRRVHSHISTTTREGIFRRREDLRNKGFRAWQSMTISMLCNGKLGFELEYP